MGYFNKNFFEEAQFIDLPKANHWFDETNEEGDVLVVYDALGGIKHTVSFQPVETHYE